MAPGCFATMSSQEMNESEVAARPASSETLLDHKTLLIFTGDEIINLEDIPLPDEPAPLTTTSQNCVLLNESKQESETKVTFKPNSNKHTYSPKLILYDTVDSFEILEQTILKQKRLARLKNTDLRRKILLKRTFDLVCEIMDHENGFEQETDSDEEEADKKEQVSSSSSSSSSDSSSGSSDSSSEESDADEEEESEKIENLDAKTNLTLVKLDHHADKHTLDDLYTSLDLIEFRFDDFVVEQETTTPQAQVPVKRRRASNGQSSDEDYSDDESDDYFLKDQQLNTVPTNLSNLSNQSLNLYSENRKKVYRKKRPRLTQDHESNDESSCLSKKLKR